MNAIKCQLKFWLPSQQFIDKIFQKYKKYILQYSCYVFDFVVEIYSNQGGAIIKIVLFGCTCIALDRSRMRFPFFSGVIVLRTNLP